MSFLRWVNPHGLATATAVPKCIKSPRGINRAVIGGGSGVARFPARPASTTLNGYD